MHLTKDFTNKYQVSKTLRFELRPEGKTKDTFEKWIAELENEKQSSDNLISEDQQRADDYQKVKKIIDRFHRKVIDESLEGIVLEGLDEYEELYLKREKEEIDLKAIENLQIQMRKQIRKAFVAHPVFKDLFKKELIQIHLKEWLTDQEEIDLVAKFKSFTTYFGGFHENRQNVYSPDAKATAVGYRMIHENLPKFLDNRNIFKKIIKAHEQLDFSRINHDLEELLQGTTVDEMFTLDFFNETLTQRGIDIYNHVLGGYTTEEGKKLQGVNEYINLYRQKNDFKARELPNLKPLFKQILSESQTASFVLEQIESDEDLLAKLKNFNELLTSYEFQGQKEVDVLEQLEQVLGALENYNMSQIYFKNGPSLTDLSQKMFGEWGIFSKALNLYYEEILNPLKGKKLTKKYENDKQRWLKSSQFSVSLLKEAIDLYVPTVDVVKPANIIEHLSKLDDKENQALRVKVEEAYEKVKEIIGNRSLSENIGKKKKEKQLIKEYLDALMDVLHLVKPFYTNEVDIEKEPGFYGLFEPLFEQLNLIVPLYNLVRNYLTQKPYSTEKFKLNFQNSTLLDGWDQNKEKANTSVLLRKDGLYYLAIMDKKHNKVFEKQPNTESDCYEKVVYKLLPGANKMLPKVFFSKKNIDYYKPSEKLQNNYSAGTHKKGSNFSLKDCHELIDFFKDSIAKHPDWSQFNFEFSDTSSYEDLSHFYREVEHQGYKIKYTPINSSYINELVDDGKIFLFKIYNKDFSPYSKGKPNLHTLYWKSVFDERNLIDTVYKLNGKAEVFFRKKSLSYDKEIMKKGHHHDMLKDRFAYPIIKNKRFALDKFQFHVPLTMNFKAGSNPNLNASVLDFLKNNPEVKIIGLDRGERHLLYLSLIDQKGNILEQYTLNEIISEYQGKTFKKDYHKLLDEKEKSRDSARKNWDVIETIKELKEGYLSQVVHKIAKMMVEHNAIVVLENLNAGFKRGRHKVEKQVYQKFEKMLIDKLNYLVFKDRKAEEPGGVLNALQLASKFDSFQKLGQQSGFLFYVPAALTSKIDPVTGFTNYLRPRHESLSKSKAFLEGFTSIHFNPKEEYFEFSFDLKNVPGTRCPEDTRTHWTVCTTHVSRYWWNRSLNEGKGGQEEVLVTERIQDLLAKHDIAYASGANLIQDLLTIEEASFFKEFLWLLNVTVSLRHNNGEHGDLEEDAIISPVADENGEFFNSMKAKATQPKDADANGAYHIALKGHWMLRTINAHDKEEWKGIKLAISNKEWLHFVQQKPFLKS